MSFLLDCPNCGPRDVNEFSCAGSKTSVRSTSFVRVSRSAWNQISQPRRWYHHSRCTPAALRRK